MRLIADTLIELPFKLDFCAVGPDVEPLTCVMDGTDVTLYFPPSLSDGTDGQGIFGDWAWWTGKTLRLFLERDVPDTDDVEALHARALETGNEVLRRFLNAYRWRFRRPDVHPIRLDARALSLQVIDDDGHAETLPEPFGAFFYRNLPDKPPLETSVNAQTLAALQEDVRQGHDPPMTGQLALDAEALDAQGEHRRAQRVRSLVRPEGD